MLIQQGLPAVAYNASKAACLQLARSCAAEWGPHGIRVNVSLSFYYITRDIA
jgi:NAD(P)-dependent dehydrogenase (short-subunit alcohol dehydrogenase family)